MCDNCCGNGYKVSRKGGFAHADVCACLEDCNKCDGLGFAIDNRDGYKFKVPCSRCSVVRENVKKYNRARIPAVMASAEVRSDGTREAMSAATYIERFINSYPEKKGFALCGSTGRGKTELAAAAVAELTLKHGVGCLFQDFADLILRLKGRDELTSEMIVLEQSFKIPFLVIDGVGPGGRDLTDWEKSVLENIISQRHLSLLKTAITTKYTKSECETRLGDRSFSRISAMCEFLPVD